MRGGGDPHTKPGMEQPYGAGASMGRIAHPEERQMRDTAEQPRNMASTGESLRPNVRTCQSCAHYVGGVEQGGLAGKCTVGELTNPVTGERFGGRPSEPRHYQHAQELRTAPPLLTSCGQYGAQWEAIF